METRALVTLAACLALVGCSGSPFTAAEDPLVIGSGTDDAMPDADPPAADGTTPVDSGPGEGEASTSDGGGEERTGDAGEAQEGSADADLPSTDADAHTDAYTCNPITPYVAAIDAGCSIDVPSRFGTSIMGGTECASAYTPPACECAGSYTCACLEANAHGTVYDPCLTNHWGTWTGCAENNGVPVVTCQ